MCLPRSIAAMREGTGSRERYAQNNIDEEDLVPQGIEGIVPYAGTVKKVMTQFCGGLQSALGYCGCRTISDLQNNGRFVRVSLAGVKEAHPHDVKIMKESPAPKISNCLTYLKSSSFPVVFPWLPALQPYFLREISMVS